MIIWIILPAFNEEVSLSRLFPKIEDTFKKMGYAYRVVVVNDGSTDQTFGFLERYRNRFPIDIITHPINRGLGETERDGFEYAASRCADDDIIIRMDCDDTHEPEYFYSLIEKMLADYDVVITSRFQPGGGQIGVDKKRAFISYSANLFMKLVFNIKGVKDYSCGYRAYRGKVIKDAIKIFGNGFIQLRGLGFTSTLETIVKLKLMGCGFSEIPFVLRYDQKASCSKMISSITTLGYIVMAILYHWPFGGWKAYYKGLAKSYQRDGQAAVAEYRNRAKSMICRIGGG